MNIEHKVIELLEAGVSVEDIARHLDLTVEEVCAIEDYACEQRDDEHDGQPDEYTEWQDLYGGDDWDHGQYDYE